MDSDDANNDNCTTMGLTDNQMDKVWDIYKTGKYSINDISTELDLPYGEVDQCITRLLKVLRPGQKPRSLGDVPDILVQPKITIEYEAAVTDYNYQKFIIGNDAMPEAYPARENETVGTFNSKTYKG